MPIKIYDIGFKSEVNLGLHLSQNQRYENINTTILCDFRNWKFARPVWSRATN